MTSLGWSWWGQAMVGLANGATNGANEVDLALPSQRKVLTERPSLLGGGPSRQGR